MVNLRIVKNRIRKKQYERFDAFNAKMQALDVEAYSKASHARMLQGVKSFSELFQEIDDLITSKEQKLVENGEKINSKIKRELITSILKKHNNFRLLDMIQKHGYEKVKKVIQSNEYKKNLNQ